MAVGLWGYRRQLGHQGRQLLFWGLTAVPADTPGYVRSRDSAMCFHGRLQDCEQPQKEVAPVLQQVTAGLEAVDGFWLRPGAGMGAPVGKKNSMRRWGIVTIGG